MNLEKLSHSELFELYENTSKEIKRRIKELDKRKYNFEIYRAIKGEKIGIIELIIPRIFEYIFREFNLTQQEIESKSRAREIVNIRHALIYCLYFERTKNNESLITLKNVGTLLGQRDHSTMIHARNKIRSFIQIKDEQTIENTEKISKEIKRLLHQYEKI